MALPKYGFGGGDQISGDLPSHGGGGCGSPYPWPQAGRFPSGTSAIPNADALRILHSTSGADTQTVKPRPVQVRGRWSSTGLHAGGPAHPAARRGNGFDACVSSRDSGQGLGGTGRHVRSRSRLRLDAVRLVPAPRRARCTGSLPEVDRAPLLLETPTWNGWGGSPGIRGPVRPISKQPSGRERPDGCWCPARAKGCARV